MFYAVILVCVCVCITRERPTFVERLRSSILRPSHPILQPLNTCQRRAVLKALTANDYILIKGMPGTGEHSNVKAVPVQAYYRPGGFQKFETPRFLNSHYMKVVRFSALSTNHLYLLGNIPGTHSY